jgi:hypothetical protein
MILHDTTNMLHLTIEVVISISNMYMLLLYITKHYEKPYLSLWPLFTCLRHIIVIGSV